MMLRVYLETTVISYLTALPSRDLVQAAHQEITREWWERRSRFELFVSEAVLEEAARGDAGAAARRLAAVEGIPVLEVGASVSGLADQLLRSSAIPAIDAVHIAVAVVNGMHYLLTWNCAHIANAALRGKIEETCRGAGLLPPIICTPEELMEE
jgi:predicted nucleic acid-binding protein